MLKPNGDGVVEVKIGNEYAELVSEDGDEMTFTIDVYENKTYLVIADEVDYGSTTELIISDDFEYIGIRSNNGAL